MHYCDPAPLPADAGPPSNRPLWLALAAAVLLHIAALGIPFVEREKSREPTRTIDLTLLKPMAKPEPQTAPQPDTTNPPAPRPRAPAERKAPQKIISTDTLDPAPAAPTAETSPGPPSQTPATEGDEAPHEGARHRSTVFDPRLREQLSHERNKVKKFVPRRAEYMTNTGTFIQHGDTCGEIRELVPQDIDGHAEQWFQIKCTKRRRPQEDIDRLARKYGIP